MVLCVLSFVFSLGYGPGNFCHLIFHFCYDFDMRKTAVFTLGVALCTLFVVSGTRAQSETGGLELTARITPTAGRPEPVRQFTFYILTKSYSEIVKDVEAKDPVPPRDQFIDGLKVSPELRGWLHGAGSRQAAYPG